MNVSGFIVFFLLVALALFLKDLFPDVQQVGILYCSAEVNSVYQAEHIAETFDSMGINHADFCFSDSNDLQTIVTNAVAECDVTSCRCSNHLW